MKNASEYTPQAFCGLYCASCPVYMDTKNGTALEKYETTCKGCKSDTLTDWCRDCKIKSCAKEKKLVHCGECNEYPCQMMIDFKEDKELVYHAEVFDNIDYMKKFGVEAWCKERKSHWTCTECGTAFGWWTENCTKCGAKTQGYKNPWN